VKRNRVSSLHEWVSEHRRLSTLFLAVGVLFALVEPAAAGIMPNHSETLLGDEG
jgi:hypothetical protein